MKTNQFGILIVLALGLLVVCCDEENNKNNPPSSLAGELTGHSSCKNKRKSASLDSATSDSLSCIDYSFDEVSKKLSLRHMNAGFNCCPESLYCEIDLHQDTIIIQEFEEDGLCDCNCLYDLDFEITGVDADQYLVRFIEPYAGDQEEIIFGIDLEKDREGSFCVIRKQYPWGLDSLNP